MLINKSKLYIFHSYFSFLCLSLCPCTEKGIIADTIFPSGQTDNFQQSALQI